METIVYRQDGGVPVLPGTATSSIEGCQGEGKGAVRPPPTQSRGRFPRAPQEGRCAPCAHAVAPNESAWHPGIVYPCMSEVAEALGLMHQYKPFAALAA